MPKISRRKILFSVAILLVFSVYATLMPVVRATAVTPQQKGLAILNSVVGLDLAKYSVTTEESTDALQVPYLGVVPKEERGLRPCLR